MFGADDELRDQLDSWKEDYSALERITEAFAQVLEASGHIDFLLLTNEEVKKWWTDRNNWREYLKEQAIIKANKAAK